ncbi:ankyrin repeat protein, partial [Colletotrichum chrysophilum]
MATQASDVMSVARSLRPDSDSLWAEAFNMLDDDLKTQINHTHNTKQDVLDKLLATTEKARQGLTDKSWSYRRKNGEKVIVRDVLVKVTKWVNHFKGVVDVAVSYDPVHAALPWAGVRFLLDAAMGDLTTYNELLDNTADVAEVICRNTLVERIIQNAQSETADELRRALTKLYASIMAYLAKAVAYYQQNTFKRVLHNGLLSSSDLDAASNAIKQAQDDVTRSSDAFSLSSQLQVQAGLQEMLKRFNAPVRRWDETLHQMTDRIDRKPSFPSAPTLLTCTGARRTDILKWISDEPYEMHHKLTHSEVLEGTGQWILCDPTYLHWANESASSILWLHGIPGSGKSKLTSVVVSQALQAFREKLAPAPVYFYCSRNPAEPGRSDPPRILASIARQLSTPSSLSSVLEPAVAMFTQRDETAFASGPLQVDETKGLILRLLEKYKDATVTIVIDALDECNPATRDILLDTLEYLLNASACLLKVFVSSRDDQDIVYNLRKYPNLTLSSDCNTTDIELFVRSETTRLVKKGSLLRYSERKEELGDKIVHELTCGAHGMFRWVALQLQALQKCCTDMAVQERLGRLPKTLRDLYQEIFTDIEKYEAESDRRITQNALSWLLCGRKQLESAVFLEAITTSENGPTRSISRDHLLQLCRNLVTFDSTFDAFRFSHLSVREFIEELAAYTTPCANALVAEACLAHLCGKRKEHSQRTPFDEYSIWFWPDHAQAAAAQRGIKLKTGFRRFFWDNQSSGFLFWHEAMKGLIERSRTWLKDHQRRRGCLSTYPTPAFVLAAYDLTGAVTTGQWKDLKHRGTRNKNDQSCEEVMAGYGEGDMIQWTFDNQVLFAISEVVLKAAAANEKSGAEIMALLLGKHGYDIQITEEVVKAAAANEMSGTEIMALLLDKRGDDIQITEEVVKAAAGNFNILKLMLDTRSRETTAVITRDTCLAAAACGDLESLRVLSDHLLPDLVDPMWESIGIFYRSAEDGDVNRIKHLLSINIPPDTKDTFGRTPLWVAADYGQEEVVRLLVSRPEVDVNSLSVSGQSPLFWPSAEGYENVVSLLLFAGAKPDLVDCGGETAISMARRNGHERVVSLLLNSQAAS